jgi:hypothetical protein
MESFKGRLRDERLKDYWFLLRADPGALIETLQDGAPELLTDAQAVFQVDWDVHTLAATSLGSDWSDGIITAPLLMNRTRIWSRWRRPAAIYSSRPISSSSWRTRQIAMRAASAARQDRSRPRPNYQCATFASVAH